MILYLPVFFNSIVFVSLEHCFLLFKLYFFIVNKSIEKTSGLYLLTNGQLGSAAEVLKERKKKIFWELFTHLVSGLPKKKISWIEELY